MAKAVDKKTFGAYIIHERQLIEYYKVALTALREHLASGEIPTVTPMIGVKICGILAHVDTDLFNLFKKMFGDLELKVGDPMSKMSYKKQAVNWNCGLPIYISIANENKFTHENVHYSAVGAAHFRLHTNADGNINSAAVEKHIGDELKRLDELQNGLLDAWNNYDKYVRANKRLKKALKKYEEGVNPYFKLGVNVWNSNSMSFNDLYPIDAYC